MLTKIKKRDGRIVPFDEEKITNAIFKAARAVGGQDFDRAKYLAGQVVKILEEKYGVAIPSVEDVQDIVEKVLIENGHAKTAKAYILYRQQHAEIRNFQNLLINSGRLIQDYITEKTWEVKENSNMNFSLQGLNNHMVSAMSKKYWLEKIYPPKIKEAHEYGDFHIHDLGLLSPYCCGWDLADLLTEGFKGAPQKIESAPPKHFRSALGQIVNFFYTLQGEAAGAQALANFDTYLAPFVRHDGLSYKDVKQAMQEFIFNINVPTRVGFQCVSEDTEILTIEGWKKYNEVKPGMTIATFNLDSQTIEYLPVETVFARPYKGKMYRLKSRITDQLVSPRHRVVRRVFNSDQYVMEPVEKILDLKTGPLVPVAGKGTVNIKPQEPVDMRIVKLAAWILADGSYDWSGRGSGRISIVQSPTKHPDCTREIEDLLKPFKYSVHEQYGLGNKCWVYRINAEGTRKILEFFGFVDSVPQSACDIKFVPEKIKQGGREVCREFLRTYLRADGDFKSKIATASARLRDDLMQVAVNAGYGVTCMTRRMDLNPKLLNKKSVYVLRLIDHADTHITSIEEIDYDGVIWCPHTKNETVVARRKGKVFITGNTPFVNLTFDVQVPAHMKKEPVIFGGKRMFYDPTYGDYQEEMNMINKAFCEVMSQGDAKGRIFTFPIPTYNITEEFFDSSVCGDIMEMTAKYGTPYFANFINSDLSPEQVRSMCCRLRLDVRELQRKGGGLFGANPLTGSVGVVTLNLPRIGYKSKNEQDFLERLTFLAELAKDSLLIKRRIVEQMTELGLYPYSKYYLRMVKERFGQYWANHFNTIGIIGMNEALLNFMGKDIGTPEGQEFALKVLDHLRSLLIRFQEETGQMFNLEATPAEGTSYRLAKIDKELYPEIITAGKDTPYYTNSTQLPVNYTDDIFEALDLQDELQTKYTGGTVLHMFTGEKIEDTNALKKLLQRIFTQYKLPYLSFTPTFSICPDHGYIPGEHFTCPHCGKESEVWSRVVGYYRPMQNWNKGKQEEYKERVTYNI
jgi:ribonucleoside-triphosphate reductase